MAQTKHVESVKSLRLPPRPLEGVTRRLEAIGLTRCTGKVGEIVEHTKKMMEAMPTRPLVWYDNGIDGWVRVKEDGEVFANPRKLAGGMRCHKEISCLPIPREYISNIERSIAPHGVPLQALVSRAGFAISVIQHLEVLSGVSSEQKNALRKMLERSSTRELASCIDGPDGTFLSSLNLPSDSVIRDELSHLMRSLLVRSARLVGSIAGVVASPRLDNPRGYSSSVLVESHHSPSQPPTGLLWLTK